MKKKKILFDIIHPSNVHYFKGLIALFKQEGHEVLVVARDKDITIRLLQAYGIPFISSGRMGRSVFSKALFLLRGEFKALALLLRHRPDIVVSMASMNFSHACFLCRVPFFAFDDTEHARANRRLYAPFATRIFTPFTYSLDLGKKQFRFRAFMELFYLHPSQLSKWMAPVNEQFRNRKFALVRYIAWEAFHDIGKSDVVRFDKLGLIEELTKHMDVYVSIEGKVPDELKPYQLKVPVHEIHSYLSLAHVYIGEGATTASEAAMVGTPAIYLNPLFMGYLRHHEQLGLLHNLGQSNDVIHDVIAIITDPQLKEKARALSAQMVSDMIDPTSFFFWYFINYPESDRVITNDPSYQFNFR